MLMATFHAGRQSGLARSVLLQTFLLGCPSFFPPPASRNEFGRATAQQFYDGAAYPVDYGLDKELE